MNSGLHTARLKSPIGFIFVVWNSKNELVALDFESHEVRMQALLRRRHPTTSNEMTEGSLPTAIRHALEQYFDGEFAALDNIRVHAGGTRFEQRVWSSLRTIAPGSTMTYGALARLLGVPNGARAVGRANGANPVAIVVPCHRVIGASGELTGYAGGLERKNWLLSHERIEHRRNI